MQGRREMVLLVGGYVFVASLAAPAVLFATEDPQPPPTTSEAPAPSAPTTLDEQPPAPSAPATLDEQPPAPEEQPTPEPPPAPVEKTEVSAPTPAGPTQTRTKNASARASATRSVAMRDIKFKPRNITIDPGDTVQWRNDDPERHNALGENGSFETPVIDEGETSSHTFDRKGSYPYFCSLHAGMTGKITVGASSGGGSGGSDGGSGGGGSETGGFGGSRATGSSTAGSSTGSAGTTATTSTSGSGSTSTLPATGSDLVWLALIGAGLLTLGAATALVARRVY
jgi:LPXTG-motif cell wall-anchored protein